MTVSPAFNYAESIVETVREPLLVLDETMRVQQANTAFYRTFQTEQAATIGFDLFKIDQGRWRHTELRRVLEQTLQHDSAVEDFRFAQEVPELGRRIVLMNARRISVPGIERSLILLAMEDATERIEHRDRIETLNAELEARVAERTAELERANKELEGFSYSVSHDLRAPLRSIDGFSRILLDDYADDLSEDAQRCLRIVRAGAQQMGELVDDLLAFSRMSRRPLERESVEPQSVIEAALNDARSEYPDHGPATTVDELPACYADPRLLKQVFFNLLSNAFKFTSKRDQPRIHVSGRRSDQGRTIYSVTDNGAGFDPRYAHKLFNVFQRLHHESEFPGTGVGLALVQRIVERHGGRVWAESEIDVGTTLHFELPRETQS